MNWMEMKRLTERNQMTEARLRKWASNQKPTGGQRIRHGCWLKLGTMKVIADSNIVYSALLKSPNRFCDTILLSGDEFYTPKFMLVKISSTRNASFAKATFQRRRSWKCSTA